MKTSKAQKELGFTLVEISIVLVIIGIIAAGILAASSIISSGESKKIASEASKLLQATSAFESKYTELPGDMSDATSYWDTTTCITLFDGNGDGQTPWGGTPNEAYSAFLHMACGRYLEADTGSGTAAFVESSIMTATTTSAVSGGYNFNYSAALGNFIQYGSTSGTNYLFDQASAKTAIAYSIDKSLDDGFADSGRVQSTGTACATGANYNVTNEAGRCLITFQLYGGS